MTSFVLPVRPVRIAFAVLLGIAPLNAFGQPSPDSHSSSNRAETTALFVPSGPIGTNDPAPAPSSNPDATRPATKGGELPFRDNAPMVTLDGRIMFFNSTRRGYRPWARIVKDSTRWDDDIYYRVRLNSLDGREHWGEPINLGPEVNTGADDGISAISSNGTQVYLVSLRDDWETAGGPFYVAELSGTKVRSVRGMGGGIAEFFATRDRSRNFQIYGAAIDAYERTFYFATTVHSARREQEIWVSHLDGGRWSYPVNLGPQVNAPGGAYAPFIAADGVTLYFASGRKGGYGGDDLYRTTLDSNGAAQGVMNLGPTINTDGDEAFFSIPASGDRVYLSSSRGGSESLVAAPLEAWMRPGGVALLSGTVVDAKTKDVLAAEIRIEDLEADTVVYVGKTSDLDDHYSTVLRPGKTYGISIRAPGYVFTSTSYSIGDTIDYVELNRNFELEKLDVNESFTLHNIFFDYNSAELNPQSAAEIRRLATLMKEQGKLRIEVAGHTDSIGSDEFNLDLSSRRARAVREFLVRSCGVEPVRVMSRGYGAHKPVATNETEEGRQENRRVEFTIVSM
jgi:outer membrane protein OmpA-like peptidoglycan-associated protein